MSELRRPYIVCSREHARGYKNTIEELQHTVIDSVNNRIVAVCATNYTAHEIARAANAIAAVVTSERKATDSEHNRKQRDRDLMQFHLKAVAGRVLTLVDALSSETQRPALNKLVRKEFREQLSRVDRLFREQGEEGCSDSSEDVAVRQLEL